MKPPHRLEEALVPSGIAKRVERELGELNGAALTVLMNSAALTALMDSAVLTVLMDGDFL